MIYWQDKFTGQMQGLIFQRGVIEISADNYLIIVKESVYRAYMQCASSDKEEFDEVLFEAHSIEEAIRKAQAVETLEYGYVFKGI